MKRKSSGSGNAVAASDWRDALAQFVPDEAPFACALTVLLDRTRRLSRDDRDDLFALLPLLSADGEEEREAAVRAVREILEQSPVEVLPMESGEPESAVLRRWKTRVGRRIREARERAGLTQIQLARRSGLPQSHISRIENAEHGPTALTREKIAVALGLPADAFDAQSP